MGREDRIEDFAKRNSYVVRMVPPMKTRTLVILLIVVAALVAFVVMTHTAGGQAPSQSIRSLHGGD